MTVNWTDKQINDFLNGVKTGKIIPKSITEEEDGKGPLLIFAFPDYSCQIHVHWKDDKHEVFSKAHIIDTKIDRHPKTDEGKDFRDRNLKPCKVIDTYTISMLRHFSGLDNKEGEKEGTGKNKKGAGKPYKLLVFALLAILVIILLNVGRSKKHNSSPNKIERIFTPYSTMVNSSGARLYETSRSAYHQWHYSIGGGEWYDAQESIGTVNGNERVSVIEWDSTLHVFKIRLENGKSGWIHTTQINHSKYKKH